MNIYQSIVDNPNMDDATRRRAMLALGRDTQGLTTAQAGQQADAYVAQNPFNNPALRQTQQDAFLFNNLGGAPKINQALSNNYQSPPGIMGVQGMQPGVNTVADLNSRVAAANGGVQPTGAVMATGPDSVRSIPVQQMQQFNGLTTNQVQGLLSPQDQTLGGLLGSQPAQTGMQPLYPMYGRPDEFRRHGTFGPNTRPWMLQGADIASNQINNYLQGQQNPAPMATPESVASFDAWRRGELARPDLNVSAQQIVDAYLEQELERIATERGDNTRGGQIAPSDGG